MYEIKAGEGGYNGGRKEGVMATGTVFWKQGGWQVWGQGGGRNISEESTSISAALSWYE